MPSYQVTLEGENLIFESFGERPSDDEVEELLNYFGLRFEEIEGVTYYEQQRGKIVAIDDDARRLAIMDLTRRFGIYSLGRYAIWKPIRVDELLGDLEKIKRIWRLSKIRREYESYIT